MRLVRYAQIIGVATGMMLLGGTALADSPSSTLGAGGGIHQKSDGDGLGRPPVSVQSPANVKDVPSVSGDNNTTDSTNTTDNTNGASSTLGGSGTATPGKAGVVAAPAAASGTAPVIQTVQPADGSLGAAPTDQLQAPTTGAPIARSANTPIIIPVVQSSSRQSGATAVVTMYRLALQPPIVSSRYAAIPDFATSLLVHASAPQTPAPPKTNGVLGELSVALDSILVPQIYGLHALTLGWMPVAMGLLGLVLILRAVYRYNYGWWLRRGGFVTAPRSDASVGGDLIPSLIATPLCMGYVKADPCAHSPSLVMSETNSWLHII